MGKDKEQDAKKSVSDKETEHHDFETKKRAAYSAMGKLGGIARAKQLAEKGFTIENKKRRDSMNTDIIKGNWHVIKGKLKKYWGKLKEDDIMNMQGSSEELAGALQKAYGYQKDEALQEIKKFTDKNKWKN